MLNNRHYFLGTLCMDGLFNLPDNTQHISVTYKSNPNIRWMVYKGSWWTKFIFRIDGIFILLTVNQRYFYWPFHTPPYRTGIWGKVRGWGGKRGLSNYIRNQKGRPGDDYRKGECGTIIYAPNYQGNLEFTSNICSGCGYRKL